MRINPILKKDIKISARSAKICWGLFAISMGLCLVTGIAMLLIKESVKSFYSGNLYQELTYQFPTISITEIVIVGIMSPVLTASSITGEKERQTFDILMTTPMKPFAIVTGKIAVGVSRILLYMIAAMPILALPFIIGGISWVNLLWFFLIITLEAVFGCTMGVFWSSLMKRTVAAIFLTFLGYIVICLFTFIPMGVRGALYSSGVLGTTYSYYSSPYLGETPLLLLFNPLVLIIGFYIMAMTGEAIGPSVYGSNTHFGLISDFLANTYAWMPLSGVLILGLCFGMAGIAAAAIRRGSK